MLHEYFSGYTSIRSCHFIESGLAIEPEGIKCCCLGTIASPLLLSAETVNSLNKGEFYDAIIKARISLLSDLNKTTNITNPHTGQCATCNCIYEADIDKVDISFIGSSSNETQLNIQPYTLCNLRCRYCGFTHANDFKKSIYNLNKVVDLIEDFESRKKIIHGMWISCSGGEPSLLKDYESIINYLIDNNIGNTCIFSNAVKYSKYFEQKLSTNEIYLISSIDCGIPSTFHKLRGASALFKVFDTLVKYRKSGTSKLWLKYNITPENSNDDDLFSFVMMMLALRPDCIYICPEYQCGDSPIPESSVIFGARLWYFLSKYGRFKVYIQSDDYISDKKMTDFSILIKNYYNKLIHDHPIDDVFNLLGGADVLQNHVNLYQNDFDVLKSQNSLIINSINYLKNRSLLKAETKKIIKFALRCLPVPAQESLRKLWRGFLGKV
jgi:hypothetical protein